MTDGSSFPEEDGLEDMDPDEARKRLLRSIVKRDMDRHREIYDVLADE
ncbi:hypothetical protein HTG_12005 [Natrinema mahii]|nr:hypothetical protein HTG_12005 [Natrinema mahii]